MKVLHDFYTAHYELEEAINAVNDLDIRPKITKELNAHVGEYAEELIDLLITINKTVQKIKENN